MALIIDNHFYTKSNHIWTKPVNPRNKDLAPRI